MFDFIKFAFAQGTVDTDFGDNVTGVTDYVNRILDWFIPIVGGVALLMMIYAGYLYMTSQGDSEKINQAKEIIIGVIVGIVLLFAIKLILDGIGVTT